MTINIISVIRSYQYVAETAIPSHVVVTSFQIWLPAFIPSWLKSKWPLTITLTKSQTLSTLLQPLRSLRIANAKNNDNIK